MCWTMWDQVVDSRLRFRSMNWIGQRVTERQHGNGPQPIKSTLPSITPLNESYINPIFNPTFHFPTLSSTPFIQILPHIMDNLLHIMDNLQRPINIPTHVIGMWEETGAVAPVPFVRIEPDLRGSSCLDAPL